MMAELRIKSVAWLIWLVPPILLVVATAHLPYGYYIFLRYVVFGIAAVISVFGFGDRPFVKVWSVPVALIGVFFNPFVPVYLDRTTWFYLDLGAAAVFVAHLIFVRVARAPN